MLNVPDTRMTHNSPILNSDLPSHSLKHKYMPKYQTEY